MSAGTTARDPGEVAHQVYKRIEGQLKASGWYVDLLVYGEIWEAIKAERAAAADRVRAAEARGRESGRLLGIHEEREQLYARMLEWRDVETPCKDCGGCGRKGYGSTSTWHGGIGGCAMTANVCDRCWGTGDEHRKGVDLRALRNGEERRVAERAVDLLARSVGATLGGAQSDVAMLADELDRLSRGRKRPTFFGSICRSLAKTLRRAIEARATTAAPGGEGGTTG